MQNSDGIIIILSYPDTVVQPSHWESWSKIWPILGIGSRNAIQAGHAALLLIHKEKPEVNYFDFGRYIISYGNGRVRSKATDPELHIPIKAKFENGQLINLKSLLLWLDMNPKKTHGEGRLIASINSCIDYNKAKNFIDNLILQKEIPYGAFIKKGSNCARFVADTIINSCTKKRIRLKLKSSYLLTPSPVGNALKGATEEKVYIVKNQELKKYTNRSIVKEYKGFFFRGFDEKLNLIGTELPNKKLFNLINGSWLGGIGSGAWFQIENKESKNYYIIARYNFEGKKDFEGLFYINDNSFAFEEKHQFIYPTNCSEAFIKQNKEEYFFKRVEISLST